MKKTVISLVLIFICFAAFSQLNIKEAEKAFRAYKVGSYSYHEKFIGHTGYGAPYILTSDGGVAFFGGSGDSLGSFGQAVKLDKTLMEEWSLAIRPQYNEIETQSIVEDKNGNFFVFLLSYDEKRYRGGSERVVCIDKKGKILWDKTLGNYTLMNNPTVSYIRALADGRIAMRGHSVVDKQVQGKDPVYRYWEGWIDSKGVYTQKTGDVIDWAKQEWQKLYDPEN
ncbi:MAG: hypothetical protein U0T33_12430 [Bacteroidales bacterium]